jgi:hypothetical protein
LVTLPGGGVDGDVHEKGAFIDAVGALDATQQRAEGFGLAIGSDDRNSSGRCMRTAQQRIPS